MKKADIIEELLGFAGTDTILYFAPYPANLTERQKQKWGAIIEKFNAQGADVKPTESLTVSPLSQQTKSLITAKLQSLTVDDLMWFRELSGAYRSVLLAFAVCDGILSCEEAFELSNLEEDFQNEMWQPDVDAVNARKIRKNAALKADKVLKGLDK